MNPDSYLIGTRNFQHNLPLEEELNFSTDKNYLFELPEYSLISVIGDKACEFLQGQLTCDINLVTDKMMRQGALCNLKGRILALLDVLNWQGYHLLINEDLLQETTNSLTKVAMLSRVTLKQNKTLKVFGLLLNNSQDLLPEFVLPTAPYQITSTEESCCYSLDNNLFLFVTSEDFLKQSIHSFAERQQVRGSIAWHYLQLLNHRVTIYPETRGLFLPHRVDLPRLGYISFDKGCYKGQEIIARTHYRAKLKHHLQTFRIVFEHQPELGTAIFDSQSNQEIGELIDYCPLGNNQYLVALSILLQHTSEIKMKNHLQPLTLT